MSTQLLTAIIATLLCASNCAANVTDLISSLPRWRSDRAFTDVEWKHYGDAAASFRQLSKNDRISAVKRSAILLRAQKPDSYSEPASVIYIFLRIVYDVNPNDAHSSSKGWIGAKKGNAMWPLGVASGGRLKLTALYQGSLGPEYIAEKEHAQFMQRYKLRSPTPAPVKAATAQRIGISQYHGKSLFSYLTREKLNSTPKWNALTEKIPLETGEAVKKAKAAAKEKYPLNDKREWVMAACCLFEYKEGHLYQVTFYDSSSDSLGSRGDATKDHITVVLLLDGTVILPEKERG